MLHQVKRTIFNIIIVQLDQTVQVSIKDRADSTSTYKPGSGLPISTVLKLKPIFEELGHEDLLSKCLHGLTQNQNESFNAVI